MIVDSSAILAILFGESDAPALVDKLLAAPTRRLSAANYLEIAIKLDNVLPASAIELDDFLRDAQIQIVDVSVEQARIARQAYRHYGKGRHPAALNFGDCFAYALAKAHAMPLLFKGNDFSRTDVRNA